MTSTIFRRYFIRVCRCRPRYAILVIVFCLSLCFYAGSPDDYTDMLVDTSNAGAQGVANREKETPPRHALDAGLLHSGNVRTAREDLILDVSANLSLVNASLSLFGKYDNIRLLYGDFQLRRPFFITEEDERLFDLNSVVQDKLKPVPLEKRRGLLTLVEDGVFIEDMDCGYTSKIEHFRRHSARSRKPRIREKYLCPLVVPQSDFFQHFIDGVLPKLMQVYDFIKESREVKILLKTPKHQVINDILNELDFGPGRRKNYDSGYAGADVQINTCITPPMHPSLWNKARHLLGVPNEIPEEPNIVLIMRQDAQSRGKREMTNNMDVMKFLTARYGMRLRVYNSVLPLKYTRSLFGNASLIIGVHGGALYNMLFAPKHASVIEIVPTNTDGSMQPPRLPITVFWELASMIGHRYWRLTEKPTSSLGNVIVNITKLESTLNRIDKNIT